jgi:uncharacterized membrane protein YraQ (UPF0718 family)
MWLLSFLPDSFLLFIVNTILIAGIIGTVVSFFFINRLARWFPTIAPYYWLLQILSIVVLVAGVYFKGGYSVEQEWRDRVAALEAKIAIAEEKSKAANSEIQTKIVTKTKVIHDTKIVIREKLKEVEKIINKDCTVASEAIDIHNAAAKNVKPGEAK